MTQMKRRSFLLLPPALVFGRGAWARAPDYPPVLSGEQLAFPRDYGAHSRYRTEWWYATGWLQTDTGASLDPVACDAQPGTQLGAGDRRVRDADPHGGGDGAGSRRGRRDRLEVRLEGYE